jgi:hypothetical protein
MAGYRRLVIGSSRPVAVSRLTQFEVRKRTFKLGFGFMPPSPLPPRCAMGQYPAIVSHALLPGFGRDQSCPETVHAASELQ